jgi:hypothetical protein
MDDDCGEVEQVRRDLGWALPSQSISTQKSCDISAAWPAICW